MCLGRGCQRQVLREPPSSTMQPGCWQFWVSLSIARALHKPSLFNKLVFLYLIDRALWMLTGLRLDSSPSWLLASEALH